MEFLLVRTEDTLPTKRVLLKEKNQGSLGEFDLFSGLVESFKAHFSHLKEAQSRKVMSRWMFRFVSSLSVKE